VRQNHRIIRVDAFEGPNCLTVRQFLARQRGGRRRAGRHPRCRPRARAHPPSIRPSPPGTVQGLPASTHSLFAQHQRNHGTRLAAFAFLASCRTVGNIESLSLIPFPHQQSCSHAGRCSPYFFDLYAFAVNACSPAYDHGFDALARFHVLPITATPST